MPLLSIETNQPPRDDDTLRDMSDMVASLLGKPASYVMIKYTHNTHMLFAGTDEPLAYVQLKSLGLPKHTSELSAIICDVLRDFFLVPPERTYIEFSSPDRDKWGWNRSTF